MKTAVNNFSGHRQFYKLDGISYQSLSVSIDLNKESRVKCSGNFCCASETTVLAFA